MRLTAGTLTAEIAVITEMAGDSPSIDGFALTRNKYLSPYRYTDLPTKCVPTLLRTYVILVDSK